MWCIALYYSSGCLCHSVLPTLCPHHIPTNFSITVSPVNSFPMFLCLNMPCPFVFPNSAPAHLTIHFNLIIHFLFVTLWYFSIDLWTKCWNLGWYVEATLVPGPDGTPRVLTAVPRETREETLLVAAVLVASIPRPDACWFGLKWVAFHFEPSKRGQPWKKEFEFPTAFQPKQTVLM